jgi:hypothetical protein
MSIHIEKSSFKMKLEEDQNERRKVFFFVVSFLFQVSLILHLRKNFFFFLFALFNLI